MRSERSWPIVRPATWSHADFAIDLVRLAADHDDELDLPVDVPFGQLDDVSGPTIDDGNFVNVTGIESGG